MKREAPQQRLSVADRKRLKKAHQQEQKAQKGGPGEGDAAPAGGQEKEKKVKKKKKKFKRKTQQQHQQHQERSWRGGGAGEGAGRQPWGNARSDGYGTPSGGDRVYVPRWHKGADRLETLTRSIGSFAQQKQLASARASFQAITDEGLEPNRYSYSNLLNAHINSGDVKGAEAAFADMQAAGFEANVVVYTTMLKGYTATGDLKRAEALLQEMVDARVWPDVRACNTFLRGCVRMGDIDSAAAVFERMDREWEVVADASTIKYMGRLLAQGLRLGALEELVGRAETMAAGDTRTYLPPCMFWEQGKCDRGFNCRFYHDPAIMQEGAEDSALELLDMQMELGFNHAHAAALLGEWEEAGKALKRAQQAARKVQESDGSAGNNALFRNLHRQELEREVARVQTFLELKQGKDAGSDALDLPQYHRRLWIFSSVMSGGGDAAADDEPPEERSEVSARLVNTLMRTAGLAECVRRGRTSLADMSAEIERCITKKKRHLGWDKVWGKVAGAGLDGEAAVLPVKLEVCSGNGDWVVAQAKAERERCNWVALELKHDRVYSIFSRMALEEVPNLGVIGGDAAQILPARFAKGSVAHICINFPEPPHHSGDDAAESQLHLLTSGFFRTMHRVLAPEGKITVFSDNRNYCQSLCRMVSEMNKASGTGKMFTSATVCGTEHGGRTSEVHGKISLYNGIPGPEDGHAANVTSYFDRFWEHGNHTDRVFFVLAKASCQISDP